MRTTCAAAVTVGFLALGLAAATSRADDAEAGRGGAAALAYVRRMAEADRPELAEARAREVLDVDLAEPVSKAVVAAVRAKRGDVEGAVSGIATAVMYGSDEPFVRRTAGRILAWRDTRDGSMADDFEASLAAMRRTVGETPKFVEAYDAARDAYRAAREDGSSSSPATLVPQAVEPEFGRDADQDAVIFASALASCAAWWNWSGASCREAWCETLVRTCPAVRGGARRAASWGGFGSSRPILTRAVWSTPRGSFSRSYVRVSYGTSCAPAPACATPPSACADSCER